MQPLIHLEGLTKVFYTDEIETHALDGVHLDIEKGEYVAIAGPSGCGKSTLLSILGLLHAPTAGQYTLNGTPVAQLSTADRARIRNREVGCIFQSFHLVPDLKVTDNVEIPLLYRKMSSAERRKLAKAALDRVGLSSRVNHFPTQLSGGQQQRVAIARAIVGKPRILLADEPTGNLDSAMGDEIMEILHDLNKNDGTTIVMVTHDDRFARRTDRIVRLFDGRQVA